MSNGLAQEFPEVAWQAVPPIGPRGRLLAVADHGAHTFDLDGGSLCDSARAGRRALARALLARITKRRSRAAVAPATARGSWAIIARDA